MMKTLNVLQKREESFHYLKVKRCYCHPVASMLYTVTEKEINIFSKGCVPKNTARSTVWEVRVFMPVFSPVLNCNSTGTVNFTVNMYPSGNIAIGNTANVEEEIDFHELFEGIDVTKDLM